MTLCTKCNKEESEWDFGEEQLCQMCFEEVCSDDWWDLVGVLIV